MRREVPSHTWSLTFYLKNVKYLWWLTDEINNSYQKLLKKRYDWCDWLTEYPVLWRPPVQAGTITKLVQVIHVGKCHWACISTIGCMKVVSVMDSLYPSLLQKVIQHMLWPLWNTKVHHLTLCIRTSGRHAAHWRRLWLYSLAFATTLSWRRSRQQRPDENPSDEALRMDLLSLSLQQNTVQNVQGTSRLWRHTATAGCLKGMQHA